MRTLNAAGLALLARAQAGERIPIVQLVYLGTTVPQRWSACGTELAWDGHTWAAQDIAIGEIEDAVTGLPDLTFTLPGVSPSQIALAFDSLEGVPVIVRDAWVNPTTGEVADAIVAWQGEVDTPGWQDGAEASVIFTAVHKGKAALRGKPWRYTDDAQRRINSTDLALDFDPKTDSLGVVWPSARFYAQG